MRAIIEGGGTGDIEEDNNSHSCSDLDLLSPEQSGAVSHNLY